MTQLLTSKLGPFTVSYENSEEYHRLKGEVFTQDSYYVELETATPLIIDAGAHIGLTTLYYKKLYPAARVVAIEPNPEVVAILEENIWQNRLDEVTVVQAALTPTPQANLTLFRDRTKERWWSTASIHKGAWTGDQKSEALSVSGVTLSQTIQQAFERSNVETVDVLKMDIEGAEQAALVSSSDMLPHIDHLFIEFHPVGGQNLQTIIELLEPYFTTTLSHSGQTVSLNKARGLILIEAHRRGLTAK